MSGASSESSPSSIPSRGSARLSPSFATTSAASISSATAASSAGFTMAEPRTARDIVLVVDDSPQTLGLLTDALEDRGVTVLVATSGERALEAIGQIVPDIILMDAVMPGVDGFETSRRLKADPSVAHVP